MTDPEALGYPTHSLARGRAFDVLLNLALSSIVVLLASGCAFNPAPVSHRAQPPSEQVGYHLVAPGDTLFAIAWRYEKDMRALARSNGLSQPYRLMPGQRLTLDTSVLHTAARAQSGSQTRTTNKPVTRSSRSSNETRAGVAVATISPSASKPSVSTESRKTESRKTGSPKPAYQPPHRFPPGKVRWRWPIKGSVSRQYDTSKVFKGINIQSQPGRTVAAAANGIVVYAGSGLRGYGKLIIIKHSDTYLSAYAHNRALSVKEGDVVKAGAKISTVGGDANNRGRLYFELRKNGKPVDPMRLLPRQ